MSWKWGSAKREADEQHLAIEPCRVVPAAGNPFTLEGVIFDQGPGGFAIGVGRWDSTKGKYRPTPPSKKTLAMRWNGSATVDDHGYPSIGAPGGPNSTNAQWFPLPDELNEPILKFIAERNLDYLAEKYALTNLCKVK